MTDEVYRFEVDDTEQDARLDLYLAGKIEMLSRSRIQKLIANGCVRVNGSPVKANYKIQVKDEIDVAMPAAETSEIAPEAINLDIIYEDNHIIVINKPRGMVVHPAAGNYQGTLVNALLSHCGDLSGINGVVRPGIVHRLDKDTSGVMVAAKTDFAHLSLAEQIKNRTASRKYLAIVHANIKEDQGIISAPIGRHPTDRKKMAVVFSNGKEAITKFCVLERFGNYTLVQCRLLTGRTHQIRVHMAYIGHPLVGDPKYGGQTAAFSIAGQALHSAELTLKHPETKEVMTFTSPLPQDMNLILTILRQTQK